jgi:hypothetical protein
MLWRVVCWKKGHWEILEGPDKGKGKYPAAPCPEDKICVLGLSEKATRQAQDLFSIFLFLSMV